MKYSQNILRQKHTILRLLIVASLFYGLNQSYAQCDLGTGNGFNLIVFEASTISPGSDVLGKALFGGNVTINTYGVGSGFSAYQGDVLLVNGNLTFDNGQVNWGDVKATGTISGNFTAPNGSIFPSTALSVNVTTIRTELETRSTYWGTLGSQNGTKTLLGSNIIQLDCNSSTAQLIFNLTAAELLSCSGLEIINGASVQGILINVSGTAVDFSSKGLSLYPSQTKIVWNFYEATTLNINAVGIKGTVLAPFAAATFANGHVDGNVVFKTMSGNGETHSFLFDGSLPCIPTCSNVTSAGTIVSNQSVCAASYTPSVMTEVLPPLGGSGTLEYQWQISTDNTVWSDIAGATSQTYASPSITATHYFRRGTRRQGCAPYIYTNVVTKTVNTPATISVTNTGPYCVGSTIQFNATINLGLGSISWSGRLAYAAFGQNPTRASVTTNMAGTYTADYTAPNGCTASATTNVTISTTSVGGTVSPASQTICENQGVLTTQHTLSGNTGTVIRWEYFKPGSGTWTDWGGAGSTTAPSNCCFDALGTWQVRVVVQNGGCAATTSTVASVIVVADPVATTSGGGSVCINGSITLSSTSSSGTGTCTRQWQSSTDNISFSNISGATGSTYAPPTSTAGTRYYRISYSCTGTNCDQAFSNAQAVIVNPLPTATATSNAPVSLGSSILLTSSGGGTYAWSGPNGFSSTSQNPVISPSTVNDYGNYSVTVTLNGCTSTATTYVSLNCSGPVLNLQNPVLISGAAGATGSRYRFSSVTTGTDAILTIVGKSHSDINIVSLDEPAATNGGYDAAFQPIIDYNWYNTPGNTDPAGEKSIDFRIDFVDSAALTPRSIVVLNMTAVDVDGSGNNNQIREFFQATGYAGYQLQSPTSITPSGTLKGKGAYANKTGVDETALDAMISYDYSNVSSISFTYGAEYGGASISASIEERLSSLQFKCYPFNNTIICPVANISISGGGTICSGGNISMSAIATGGAGTCTLQWQSSTGSTWTNIAGATSTTYSPTNITTTTSYRTVYSCTGALCPISISNAITVTVVPDPSVSVAVDIPTICITGTSILTATVSNGTGTTSYQWQYLSGSTWTNVPSGGTGSTYSVTGVSAGTTSYRVNITQTGNDCNAVTSSPTTVTVVANPSVTTSVNNSTVCVGGTATLSSTVSGGTGSTSYQWQVSTDLLSWANVTGAISSTYSPPTTTAGVTYYRVIINQTGTGCPTATSNNTSFTVVDDPSVSITVPPAIVCIGANITLTATPTVSLGTCTVQWQSSPNGTTWTNISGATSNTYNVTSLSASTRYRAQLVACTGNGCCN